MPRPDETKTPRSPGRARRAILAGLLGAILAGLLLSACAHTQPSRPPTPERPATMPPDRPSRRAALNDLAERLFAAMVEAELDGVLYSVDDLEVILDEAGVERVRALRLGLPTRVALDPRRHGRFAETELHGMCVLGARNEPAGTAIGLKGDAWVLDRALIVGHRPGGERLGAWFEGTFVYSNAGFRAIDLRRVETPRWEHADLELVTCDMQVGLDDPLDVGMVTD